MSDSEKGTHYLQTVMERNEAKESALRPLSFSDFRGQDKTIERLEVIVGAARGRGDVLNHVLLSGPSGLGKTFLSLPYFSFCTSSFFIICFL